MKEIIDELVRVGSDGIITKAFEPVVEAIGEEITFRILMKILGWAPMLHPYDPNLPLELSSRWWCTEHVPTLFELYPPIQQVFELKDGQIDFRHDMSEEDKQELREYIDQEYPTFIEEHYFLRPEDIPHQDPAKCLEEDYEDENIA